MQDLASVARLLTRDRRATCLHSQLTPSESKALRESIEDTRQEDLERQVSMVISSERGVAQQAANALGGLDSDEEEEEIDSPTVEEVDVEAGSWVRKDS